MINQLTFTRFIAAILIVILHFGVVIKSQNISFINDIWEHLNLGVSYFFVLSGFVMAIAYAKYETIDKKIYYIKRFARIYPLHLLTLLLILSFNYLYISDYKLPKLATLSQLLLIQSWIPRAVITLNVPAWSISVEAFFYLLFPLLMFRFNKMSLKTLLIISIGFNVFCQILLNEYFFSSFYRGFRPDGFFLFYNPILHLNSFIIGMMFGQLFNRKQLKVANYDILIIVLFCIQIGLIYLLKDLFIHNGFFALTFGLLIFMISLNNGAITKLFSHRKLIHLGNISFAIYLLQFPVFLFFDKLFRYMHLNNPTVEFILALIILTITSHYTYKFIEIPLQNFINSKFIKKR